MPEMWETVTFTNVGETHGSVIRADFDSPADFIDQTALAVLMFYRNPLGEPAEDLELRTLKNKNSISTMWRPSIPCCISTAWTVPSAAQ